jgi:hypothetical protein
VKFHQATPSGILDPAGPRPLSSRRRRRAASSGDHDVPDSAKNPPSEANPDGYVEVDAESESGSEADSGVGSESEPVPDVEGSPSAVAAGAVDTPASGTPPGGVEGSAAGAPSTTTAEAAAASSSSSSATTTQVGAMASEPAQMGPSGAAATDAGMQTGQNTNTSGTAEEQKSTDIQVSLNTGRGKCVRQ